MNGGPFRIDIAKELEDDVGCRHTVRCPNQTDHLEAAARLYRTFEPKPGLRLKLSAVLNRRTVGHIARARRPF